MVETVKKNCIPKVDDTLYFRIFAFAKYKWTIWLFYN